MNEPIPQSTDGNQDLPSADQPQSETHRTVPRAWGFAAVLGSLSLGAMIVFSGQIFQFSAFLLLCPPLFLFGLAIWRKGGEYSLLSFKDFFSSANYSMDGLALTGWIGAMCINSFLVLAVFGALAMQMQSAEDPIKGITYKGRGLDEWEKTLRDTDPETRREAVEAIYAIAMADGEGLDKKNQDKIPFVHEHRDSSAEAKVLMEYLDREVDPENRIYCAVVLISLSQQRAGYLLIDDEVEAVGQAVLLTEAGKGNAANVCKMMHEHFCGFFYSPGEYVFHLADKNLKQSEDHHFFAALMMLREYHKIYPEFIQLSYQTEDLHYWDYLTHIVLMDPDRNRTAEQKKLLQLEAESARQKSVN